jgi:anti-sigma B factor antagonist
MPDQHFLAAVPRTDPPFECSCSERGLDAAWVHVTGALDIATTPQLAQSLREAQLQARLVVLDLRELAFMDSAGVHAIVEASCRARKAGRRLLLLRGPASVDRLFPLTGTADEVEIGDLGPVESAFRPLQRALVSSSLLKTGDRMNGHRPSH